jgi:hypothetical protein
MRQTLLTAVVLGVALFGCGEKKKVRAAPPSPPTVRTAAHTAFFEETGIASWYGHPYHGRASASGEIYDMEQMTAAHRTLPFGAQIRVHNLTNEKNRRRPHQRPRPVHRRPNYRSLPRRRPQHRHYRPWRREGCAWK